ncbi:substrate-binding periplasmic protein [Halomonas maura]|uniref:substrate-binding periplasmic protein n=1 Tax=Halomonas maura TaxID=117606 RepID=UPI0025B59A08|nr:transporter substrate-binding domain-containing protein [Halomonas maura]MDN3557764.1 transporter substrate-binding domain-containing protein [Halomonas maura]
MGRTFRHVLGRCLSPLVIWLAVVGSAQALTEVRDQEQILAAGTLRVAVYRDFPPYSFTVEGEPRGVDVAIARELAADLGVELRLHWLAPDETLGDDLRNAIWKGHYLRPGQIADVMMRVPYDRDYAFRMNALGEVENELVHMFAPYQVERWQLAYDAERLDGVASLALFQHHPIGVQIDQIPDFYLSSAFRGRLNAQTHRYRTPRQAFQAMHDGEVAAMMAMRAQVEWLLGEADAPDGRYRLADEAFPQLGKRQWQLGLAVHEVNRSLAYALEDTIMRLIRSGEMARLYAAYHLGYEVPAMYRSLRAAEDAPP